MPTARLRLLHAHLAPATATASATAEAAAAAAADTTIDQSESDRIAAEFQRTGVVVLPGFFAPPALAPLNDAIAQLVATTQPWSTDVASRRGPYKDKYKALFDTELVSLPFTANHPDAVAALLADRKLAAVTAAVLGADYTELGPMCFGYGTGMEHGWHQDSGSTDPEQFTLNRIVYPSTMLEGQGALHFVPGSINRHGGLLTNAAVDGNHGAIDGEVRLLPTAGTLVLMHTRCYHRVDTNHTDVPRVMLNTRATARDARDDLCRYPVFVSQTWDHATGEPW